MSEAFRLAGRSAAVARHLMLPGALLCWPMHEWIITAVWGPPWPVRRW